MYPRTYMKKPSMHSWHLGKKQFNTEGFSISPSGELRITSGGDSISVIDLVKKYGSPLQIFMPEVAETRARRIITAFDTAIQKTAYPGRFSYHYPMKANQRKAFIQAVLKGGAEIETSSANELFVIEKLYRTMKPQSRPKVICNGPKREPYIALIKKMHREHWNIVPIYEDAEEMRAFASFTGPVGIRVDLNVKITARWHKKHNYFGFAESAVLKMPAIPNLTLIHYHLSSQVHSVKDFVVPIKHAVGVYAKLKKKNPGLETLNIGGGAGLPYEKKDFYTTESLAHEIVTAAQETARAHAVTAPNLICEWGQHVVAPSQISVFKIIGSKDIKGAKAKKWYAIDGSFVSHLPDTWALGQAWHVAPITQLTEKKLVPVWFAGSSCDSDDQYKVHGSVALMPECSDEKPLYVAFFDTGAYQNALASHHCLLPSPTRIAVRGQKVTVLQKSENAEEIGKRFGW